MTVHFDILRWKRDKDFVDRVQERCRVINEEIYKKNRRRNRWCDIVFVPLVFVGMILCVGAIATALTIVISALLKYVAS